MINHSLISEQIITTSADAAKIWKIVTDPFYIKQYLFGTEAISEWKEGSELIFQGEWDGKPYRDKGIINIFRPCETFQYSYWSGFSGLEDTQENYSLVTYKIADKGNERTLAIHQTGFKDEVTRTHSAENWKAVLDHIGSMLIRM